MQQMVCGESPLLSTRLVKLFCFSPVTNPAAAKHAFTGSSFSRPTSASMLTSYVCNRLRTSQMNPFLLKRKHRKADHGPQRK